MRILLATDGSPHSMKAVQRGLELAEREGAQITLMSVALFAGDFDELMPNTRERLEETAAIALKQAKALFDEKGIPVEAILEAGTVPANNIIERAESGKFDGILLGSQGITGIKRYLIGSTAAKVVANAPCTVTVIR